VTGSSAVADSEQCPRGDDKETINGLYKTELINPHKPWRTIDEVEYATAKWVAWFNHHRLYEHCGDIPPVELERAYYAQQQRPAAS
jgi:putative transposase